MRRNEGCTRHLAASLMVVAVATMVLSVDASGATGDQKCAAAKMKAAGKKFFAQTKCRQKAILGGTTVDPVCLAKAEDKFAAAIAKADLAGICPGTAVGIEATVDDCIEVVAGHIVTSPVPVCGNNVIEGAEQCDGTSGGACPGLCQGDCTCPVSACGNDVRHGDEECDGTDDAECPGDCQGDCTCAPTAPACCEHSIGCGGGTRASCISAGGTPVGGGAICGGSGNCSSAPTTSLCCPGASAGCGIIVSPTCIGGFAPAPSYCMSSGQCIKPRFVFVTTESGTGNLSTWTSAAGGLGLSAADNVCGARAAAAGFIGTFSAWMSDTVHDATERFPFHDSIPYALPNGAKVADDWADLTDGTLDAPINMTEVGTTVTASVWTGSDETGSFDDAACTDWTSIDVTGACGLTSGADASWTTGCGTEGCHNVKRLYCVEQQ